MDQFNTYDYYVVRAQASRALAQRAANPAIAAIHEELVARYEDILAQTGLVATQRDVEVPGA